MWGGGASQIAGPTNAPTRRPPPKPSEVIRMVRTNTGGRGAARPATRSVPGVGPRPLPRRAPWARTGRMCAPRGARDRSGPAGAIGASKKQRKGARASRCQQQMFVIPSPRRLASQPRRNPAGTPGARVPATRFGPGPDRMPTGRGRRRAVGDWGAPECHVGTVRKRPYRYIPGVAAHTGKSHVSEYCWNR